MAHADALRQSLQARLSLAEERAAQAAQQRQEEKRAARWQRQAAQEHKLQLLLTHRWVWQAVAHGPDAHRLRARGQHRQLQLRRILLHHRHQQRLVCIRGGREQSKQRKETVLERKERLVRERQQAAEARAQQARDERDRQALQRSAHAHEAAQHAELERSQRHSHFQVMLRGAQHAFGTV